MLACRAMTTPYDKAKYIQQHERDLEMPLDDPAWRESSPLPGWKRCPSTGNLYRTIDRGQLESDDSAARNSATDDFFVGSLTEWLLRFPSAPIHGVQRLHEHHYDSDESETMHTYRVMMAPEHAKSVIMGEADVKVDRIILFHNGLNETDRMTLYYQLASRLIAVDRDAGLKTVCILRPFPEHLTRFPFHKHAEEPLERYLWDGSQLFRQFLRYMVETQWFLSILARRSLYACPSGALLLAGNATPSKSRLRSNYLARRIATDWRKLYEASERATIKADRFRAAAMAPARIQEPNEVFLDVINSLRKLLNLEEYDEMGSELASSGSARDEPSVHVIGYSLGGYTAQSIFMAWPFFVASCGTLLSGGALRELAPTAFADPEEWQTVLHSLRYELNEAMMGGRYLHRRGMLAGMERERFLYFQHVFDEIFQQEYRGSFESRLTEFRHRMLFVVGGDDPIVRAKSVLDSAPDGGINLLEIAGLGHFLGSAPKSNEEGRQRSFWLPEMARLISRFCDQTANQQHHDRPYVWLDPKLRMPDRPAIAETEDGYDEDHDALGDEIVPLDESDRFAIRSDGALPSELFEKCLNDLLARQTHDGQSGYLWILRNEMPTMLLDEDAVLGRGCAFHRDDIGIARYCRGIKKRREAVFGLNQDLTFVIPWNARRIMEGLDSDRGFPSQAEAAVGGLSQWIYARRLMEKRDSDNRPARQAQAAADGLSQRSSAQQAWDACANISNELTKLSPTAILAFDGREPLTRERAVGTDGLIPPEGVQVTSLPDCWIWVSREVLGLSQIAASTARSEFISATRKFQDKNSDLAVRLRDDKIRVVTVSRARYNPRFRGRLVVDVDELRRILLHAALCLSVAQPIADLNRLSALEPADGVRGSVLG
jgi:pimeloyl-ACP methyl ester carboxylesterase